MGITRQKDYPMTYLSIALIIAGWLLCSVIAYAGSFAYWQGEYPFQEDERKSGNMRFSIMWSLAGGPISLVVSFLGTGFYKHGLRLW